MKTTERFFNPVWIGNGLIWAMVSATANNPIIMILGFAVCFISGWLVLQ